MMMGSLETDSATSLAAAKASPSWPSPRALHCSRPFGKETFQRSRYDGGDDDDDGVTLTWSESGRRHLCGHEPRQMSDLGVGAGRLHGRVRGLEGRRHDVGQVDHTDEDQVGHVVRRE